MADFELYKRQFVFDIKTIIEMEEIPPEMVLNWDHTGINYVPVSSWTMEKEGSKRVEIAGFNDKRQLTAVLAGTMSGEFLFPQVIYAGKTPKCLPTVKFPSGWHVTFTENHWANEKTTEDYINYILLPYILAVSEKLSHLTQGIQHWLYSIDLKLSAPIAYARSLTVIIFDWPLYQEIAQTVFSP